MRVTLGGIRTLTLTVTHEWQWHTECDNPQPQYYRKIAEQRAHEWFEEGGKKGHWKTLRHDLAHLICSNFSSPASNNSTPCPYVLACGQNKGNICGKVNCKRHFTCPGGVKWTFRTTPTSHFVASVTNHTCGNYASVSTKTTQYPKKMLSTFISREMENGTTFNSKDIQST